ncbi:hypothetical protein L208DRAFT_1253738, partial [Tricholoma matsutake]
TTYKQYNQCYADHKNIMVSKCIWSYLSQFLTILDEPRAKFKVISRAIIGNSSHHWSSPNRSSSVQFQSFFGPTDWTFKHY